MDKCDILVHFLNISNAGEDLVSGRLFQAVWSDTENERSPNFLQAKSDHRKFMMITGNEQWLQEKNDDMSLEKERLWPKKMIGK